MEIHHRIIISQHKKNSKRLISLFKRLGIEYSILGNELASLIEYSFSEHDRNAKKLLAFAKRHDITIQSDLLYDEEEILSAEWVIAHSGESQYPQPEDGFGFIEITYNTEDYCGRCGQGLKQERPFQLKHAFIKDNGDFFGLHWVFDEIFVRPEIQDLFDSSGVTDVNFLNVINHKTNEPFNNLFQLHIPVLKEKALDTENLFTVTCKPQNEESFVKGMGHTKDKPGKPFCGRVKYHNPRTELIKFEAGVLKNAPDIVKSQEYYGSGAGANRFVLMRNRVVRLMKEKGLRGLVFRRPVHLV